ncbi:myosin II light chain [Spiromyces aspiralis]|uniref:Myosin II light chain n=1 Tax=Spiromyces aspiralis TaxID=68401 RepID=A0ACC1HG95_9FUNG|nr:myosin II light chain [Spiromyces aspiralis]
MTVEKPTPQQMDEYKEAFTLFDRTGEGKVPLSSVGTLLRALGQNPTESELNDLLRDFTTDSLDFDTFLGILLRPGGFDTSINETSFNEFIQAFQVFDREANGFISAGELRYILTSLGDKLKDTEIDELLKTLNLHNEERIKYEDFVKRLLEA